MIASAVLTCPVGGWCGGATIVAWWLALRLYPPEAAALPGGSDYLERQIRSLGPWSPAEIRAALLLSLAIGVWVTDFLHQIPAPMIGLGVGLLAIMPGAGVLNADDLRKINYLPIFFVAAAVSLSNVLAETKALDIVTMTLFHR